MRKMDIVIIVILLALGAGELYQINVQDKGKQAQELWMQSVVTSYSWWQNCYKTAYQRDNALQNNYQLQNDLEICSQSVQFPAAP